MFPATIADDHGSHAESRVFRKLHEETPDEWTALHSVGLAHHQSKPWAEIDFVLITEDGVFCLEVKGGRIEHHQGAWYTNDHQLRESPFAQAGGGSSALYEYLAAKVPAVRRSIVGHGVLFPDVHFDRSLPEVVPELIYDDDDLTAPMSTYIRRLSKYWSQRVAAVRHHEPQQLSRGDRSLILHHLAPDFDLTPSLRALVANVDDELIRLTAQQKELLDGFIDSPRVLIRGGAGTGKTLIACEEAIRLARSGRRTLYCCYSRRLADHLRLRLAEADVDVAHAHGLMSTLIRQADRQSQLPPVDPRDLFDIYYPQVALDALQDLEQLGSFDALILDEGQDLLKETYVQFFDALLRGELDEGVWRIFLDPHQDIFLGGHPKELERLELHASAYRLQKNCRNTRQIATATSVLSAKALPETLQATGPDVTEDWYTDAAGQAKLVAKRLREWTASGLGPDQIVVLSPHRYSESILAEIDKSQLPYPVIDVSEHDASDNKRIRFSTIAGFKGLEADAVLLTDITDLSKPASLSRLYVGTSRAKALLGIALHERCRELYQERASDLFQSLLEESHLSSPPVVLRPNPEPRMQA